MSQTRTQKVVVGMSGGVDSSVTAWLLKQQGYEVLGLFMKNWEDDDDGEYCSTRQDWIDVVSVADWIGSEVEAVNFATETPPTIFRARALPRTTSTARLKSPLLWSAYSSSSFGC